MNLHKMGEYFQANLDKSYISIFRKYRLFKILFEQSCSSFKNPTFVQWYNFICFRIQTLRAVLSLSISMWMIVNKKIRVER